jgi:hypothetical protein
MLNPLCSMTNQRCSPHYIIIALCISLFCAERTSPTQAVKIKLEGVLLGKAKGVSSQLLLGFTKVNCNLRGKMNESVKA